MRNQKGMTLVEILVAMGLMVMVAFCFTPFMLSSLQNVQVAGDQRENLYTQKGDIEEQIAEGIDVEMTDNLDGVAVDFTQNGEMHTGTAQGLYLTSDLLTTFIARDTAELDIYPNSVSETCPDTLEIQITCEFMEFVNEADGTNKFKLKESEGEDIWTDVSWAKFLIIDKSNAVMRANGSYDFDLQKVYRIYYGEDVFATLRVTPSPLIAVGSDGAYYVYTAENRWEAGKGTNSGKLGGYNLLDVVWTGDQYVAAGESGSWYYTEDGYGWKAGEGLSGRNGFNSLYTYDGQIYVSGFIKGSWFRLKYRNEQKITLPSEIKDGDIGLGEFLNSGEEGTAVISAKFGAAEKELWAFYNSQNRQAKIAYGARSVSVETKLPGNAAVSDMEYNGRTGTEDGDRSEVIAVAGENILRTYDGTTFVDNDYRNDESRVPNDSKPQKKVFVYSLKDEETLEVPFEESEGMPITPIESGDSYQIVYDGTTYTLDGDTCSLITEDYFEQSTISIGGTLNTVSYGELSSGGIWVVGGSNVWQDKTRSYTKDVTRQDYKLDENGQWVVDGLPTTDPNQDDTDEINVNQPRTHSNILWRDANEYGAGEWNTVTLPNNCPPINDIEFIGGKFYAVGDGGWILVSEDGKEWTRMNMATGLNKNLYGIAGWGDDWGTD